MFKNIILVIFGFVIKLGRLLDKENQHRLWSNRELEKFSHLFRGSVCNVSGWEDSCRDVTGRKYKDLFSNCSNYTLTNYPGARGYSQPSQLNQISLDLSSKLPKKLVSKFDVVFNHTTLEHIFEIEKAVKNLSLMSKDLVIIVIPFLQEQHFDNNSYGDFWRMTPAALCQLLKKNNIHPLYFSVNDSQPWYPIYVFFIGSKYPKRWRRYFKFNVTKALQKKVGENLLRW